MTGHLITIGVGLSIAGLFLWKTASLLKRSARRKRLLGETFPEQWESIIKKYLPFYKHMPAELKQQLHGLIHIFLDEKRFEGCGGQEITDEVKITIAAQACILLLNRKTRYYPKLKTIYVYPYTYVAKEKSVEDGLIVEGRSPRLGESWQNGPVVLTWDSITGGARNNHDGHNVIFHEFAHQLDQEDGSADGAPILENRSCYRTWAQVLSKEYENLRDKTRSRHRSVLNKYGATNPAEFFAVATEAFFEKSKQMQKQMPELYEELKNYYKVDPVHWS